MFLGSSDGPYIQVLKNWNFFSNILKTTHTKQQQQQKNPSRPISLDGVQIKTNSTAIYFVYDWEEKWAKNCYKEAGLAN